MVWYVNYISIKIFKNNEIKVSCQDPTARSLRLILSLGLPLSPWLGGWVRGLGVVLTVGWGSRVPPPPWCSAQAWVLRPLPLAGVGGGHTGVFVLLAGLIKRQPLSLGPAQLNSLAESLSSRQSVPGTLQSWGRHQGPSSLGDPSPPAP